MLPLRATLLGGSAFRTSRGTLSTPHRGDDTLPPTQEKRSLDTPDRRVRNHGNKELRDDTTRVDGPPERQPRGDGITITLRRSGTASLGTESYLTRRGNTLHQLKPPGPEKLLLKTLFT